MLHYEISCEDISLMKDRDLPLVVIDPDLAISLSNEARQMLNANQATWVECRAPETVKYKFTVLKGDFGEGLYRCNLITGETHAMWEGKWELINEMGEGND